MHFLSVVSRGISRLNYWVGRVASWLSLMAVILVFFNVVMRYGFQVSNVFLQELEWHLFAMIFLLGAGYTLMKDGHVRVDVIYQKLTPRGKAWVNLIGTLLFLFPGCFLLIATSWPFVVNSFNMAEISPDPGGIPYRYLLKGMIPLGYLFIALQGISLMLSSIETILGTESTSGQKEKSC